MAMRLFLLALLSATACGGSRGPLVITQALSVGGRPVTLYRPAFQFDAATAYFLVLNDGQEADALGVSATLTELWSKKQLAPMVVISIPANNRLQEYGTAEHGVSIACDAGSMGTLGTKAADYAGFVVGKVLPAVADAVGFRPPPSRTGLLGASLGGLSAFSIAWDNPQAFGFAGAMSGSFWWRTSSASLADQQSTRIMQNIVARSTRPPGFRAFLEAGTMDETADRDGNGIIDAIDDTLWLMQQMKGLGMTEGADYTYLQVAGGIHAYSTWSGVFPTFLLWAAKT